MSRAGTVGAAVEAVTGAAVEAWKQHVPRSAQQRVIEGRLVARRLVDRRRPLPELLVIGAQRAGTSSLYKWLEAHPAVVSSLRKETEYLTSRWCRGEDWYRAHFPSRYRRRLEERVHHHPILSFEASPNYLFHPYAPERAARLVPDARLVALVRDPVERAWSHWQHEVRAGREELSFEDALDAEDERLAGEEERMASDPCYRSLPWERHSYVARGMYAPQLERWQARFGPDRLLVVHSADLYRDPRATYLGIVEFAGLPAWAPRTFGNYSYGRRPKPSEPVALLSDAVRHRLATLFAPHNRRLYALVGRDFGWEGAAGEG